ncbi:MAG: hypothetical protein AAGI34_06320 [Pseudomonadota bacterium]
MPPLPPLGFPPQSDQAQFRSLLSQLRTRGETVAQEAVTSRAADPAKSLGGAVGEAIEIQRTLTDLDDYGQAIALAETRAGLAQTSLSTAVTLADEVFASVTLALQSESPVARDTAGREAQEALGRAVAALNVSLGGRGLFAGDSAGGPPLSAPETILAETTAVLSAAPGAAAASAALRDAFDDPAGLYATTLYQGGTGNAPPLEARPGERIAYQARADEPPVRDLLRALSALAAAFNPSNAIAENDRPLIAERAAADLQAASAGLTAMRARIGSAEERIATVKTENTALETALTVRTNDLIGRDPTVAAAELQAVETQLETLFLTTARFNQLSLANFLR